MTVTKLVTYPERKAFAFDALLPDEGTQPRMSAPLRLNTALAAWLTEIEREQCADHQETVALLGLSPVDGALTGDRNNYRTAAHYAINEHAFGQLVNLLSQKLKGDKARVPYMPQNLGFYSPRTRSQMFGELRDRTKREAPVILRTAMDYARGARYVRAAVTPRHGLTAFDDRNLILALGSLLPEYASLSFSRGPARTFATVRMNHPIATGCGTVDAAIHVRNSETCQSRLTFSAGLHIGVIDSTVDFEASEIAHEMEIDISEIGESRRRNHTAPARFGREQHDATARARMKLDLLGGVDVRFPEGDRRHVVKGVVTIAKEMPAAWEAALSRFCTIAGFSEAVFVQADPAVRGEILLDAIEEHGGGFADTDDRKALAEVIKAEERLGRLPLGSAAHVAAAYAVCARVATSTVAAKRFSQLAGQWILNGWKR